MRRRRVPLTLLALVMLAYVACDRMETRALAGDVAAIAARGEPTTLDADPSGAETPERRDAARIYAAAAERQRAMPQELTFGLWRLDVDGTVQPPDVADLEKKYPADAPALQLLDQATPLDFDGFGDVAPDLVQRPEPLTTLALLADLRADISSARGRGDLAVESLFASARLQRTLTGTFDRSQAATRLLASLRILFRHTAPSAGSLAKLQTALMALPDTDTLVIDIQRNRARFLDSVDRAPESAGEAIAWRIMRPWFAREARQRLRAYDEALAMAATPWPRKLAAADALEDRLRASLQAPRAGGMFQRVVHPYGLAVAVAPTGQAGIELAARRVAIALLAVERYRRTHAENAPTSLAQLVPAYLPAAPMDPFTGSPLIYRAQPDAYVLYSVDTNRKDDGGSVYGVGSKAQLMPRQGAGRDLGVRVDIREAAPPAGGPPRSIP